MLIRPELEALRSDDAPQRRAQAAIHEIREAWRRDCGGVQAEAELAAFGSGAVLEDLPLLAALFAPDERDAQAFVAGAFAPVIGQLRREPLSQAPFRYATDAAATSLVIARHGTTALTVQAVDGAALARRPAPATVRLLPAETWERILAGHGTADRVRATRVLPDRAELAVEPVQLAVGEVYHRLGTREALVPRSSRATLVLLRLQRRLGRGGVTREYRLGDGKLVHQAAGTPRDSRLELTAALLGRMGRRDAAPLLAAMAEEEGSPSLRWQALRECLALDTEAGFRALCRLARSAGDPLAAPAGALRAQLLETHPELSGILPCPA